MLQILIIICDFVLKGCFALVKVGCQICFSIFQGFLFLFLGLLNFGILLLVLVLWLLLLLLLVRVASWAKEVKVLQAAVISGVVLIALMVLFLRPVVARPALVWTVHVERVYYR